MCSSSFSRRAVLAGGAAAIAARTLGVRSAAAADSLNALVWCDHTDASLLKPFEQANGVKVNTKEFDSTGAAIAILEQSQPGDWDVLVLDAVDIGGVAKKRYLARVPPAPSA